MQTFKKKSLSFFWDGLEVELTNIKLTTDYDEEEVSGQIIRTSNFELDFDRLKLATIEGENIPFVSLSDDEKLQLEYTIIELTQEKN
jgi:hypothetical protein